MSNIYLEKIAESEKKEDHARDVIRAAGGAAGGLTAGIYGVKHLPRSKTDIPLAAAMVGGTYLGNRIGDKVTDLIQKYAAEEKIAASQYDPTDLDEARQTSFGDSRLAAAGTAAAVGIPTAALVGKVLGRNRFMSHRLGTVAGTIAGGLAGLGAGKAMSNSVKTHNADLMNTIHEHKDFRQAYMDKKPGWTKGMSDAHAAYNDNALAQLRKVYGKN